MTVITSKAFGLQFGRTLVKPRSLRSDKTTETISFTCRISFSALWSWYWYCRHNTHYMSTYANLYSKNN